MELKGIKNRELLCTCEDTIFSNFINILTCSGIVINISLEASKYGLIPGIFEGTLIVIIIYLITSPVIEHILIFFKKLLGIQNTYFLFLQGY